MAKTSKKLFGIALAALMIGCICLVGCSPSGDDSSHAKNEELGLEITNGEAFLDYTLKPGFAATIDFTNDEDMAAPFVLMYKVSMTQDGVELATTYATGTEGSEAIDKYEDVEPGAKAAIQATGIMTSESPVRVEVRPVLADETSEPLVWREFDVKDEYKYLTKD